jgi:hypothetical protein
MRSDLSNVTSHKQLYFSSIDINVCYTSRLMSDLLNVSSNKQLYFSSIGINVCYTSRVRRLLRSIVRELRSNNAPIRPLNPPFWGTLKGSEVPQNGGFRGLTSRGILPGSDFHATPSPPLIQKSALDFSPKEDLLLRKTWYVFLSYKISPFQPLTRTSNAVLPESV